MTGDTYDIRDVFGHLETSPAMTHTTNASSSAPEEGGGMCGLDGFASGSWGDCARTAASYPGDTAFLDERAVGAACDFIGLSAELRVALLADLPRYARQPQLRRAVWHCRALLAADDFDIKEVASWPMPTPKGGSDNQMFERVFGRRYERIEEAPQKTALQKAIVAHAKSGGHFHHAGMLRTAPSVAEDSFCPPATSAVVTRRTRIG